MKKLLAPLAGIVACVLIILFCASTPINALRIMFVQCFTSPYYFGEFLSAAGFLMLAGTGACVSLKGGHMNLGGEGQIYLGGFIGCMLLNGLKGPTPLVFILSLFGAALASSLMAFISAILKEHRGAEVLLTSFLASAAAIPLVDGLITASKSTSGTNMLALPYIDQSLRMKQILYPSPLSISIFISVVVCLVAWYVIKKTRAGRIMKLWEVSPMFARYGGFNSKANTYSVLLISGALHGLTGFFAVAGTYYTCHKDFYLGMGWNALSAALIAGGNPLAIIPVSLLLGWLYTSADRVALLQSFSFDMGAIIQGIVLFTIAVPFAVKKFHLPKINKGRNQ